MYLNTTFDYNSVESLKNAGAARVDPISVTDQEKFQRDLEECAQLAYVWHQTFQRQVLIGAIVGAGLGAGLGAATGSILDRRTAMQGMGLGAAYGSVAGAAAVPYRVTDVMTNCLQHRGYMLLWR